MRFTKTEKIYIKAIVKYSADANSLVDAINKSCVLEKRGWNIVKTDDRKYYLFYRQDKYRHEDELLLMGELAELLALLDKLYNERLLIAFPSSCNAPLVIGKENVERYRLDSYSVDNGREYILLSPYGFGWYSKDKKSMYGCGNNCTDMVLSHEKMFYSAYYVSQELRDLVKHNFKSEEDIRFSKQQWLTWISIFVALFIGLLGIYIK